MSDLEIYLEAMRGNLLAEGDPPAIKVVSFARLQAPGETGHVDLFHIERGGVDYVVTKDSAFGMLKLGQYAAGKRASVAQAFKRVLANFRDATDQSFTHVPMEVVTTKMDTAADKALRLIGDPTWGIQRWDLGQDADADDAEAQDFHRLLKGQVDRWKGSFTHIDVLRHSYWPTFQAMVLDAVRKKYGSKVVLYRALYGKPALDIIQGRGMATRKLASWTDDPQEARAFLRGHPGIDKLGRETPWVIVKKTFKPEQVIFAPVKLPEYGPDPGVLDRFGWESEVVPLVEAPTIPRQQLVIHAKTKGKSFR